MVRFRGVSGIQSTHTEPMAEGDQKEFEITFVGGDSIRVSANDGALSALERGKWATFGDLRVNPANVATVETDLEPREPTVGGAVPSMRS